MNIVSIDEDAFKLPNINDKTNSNEYEMKVKNMKVRNSQSLLKVGS